MYYCYTVTEFRSTGWMVGSILNVTGRTSTVKITEGFDRRDCTQDWERETGENCRLRSSRQPRTPECFRHCRHYFSGYNRRREETSGIMVLKVFQSTFQKSGIGKLGFYSLGHLHKRNPLCSPKSKFISWSQRKINVSVSRIWLRLFVSISHHTLPLSLHRT